MNQNEVNTRLQQAMALHQQGRLPEAERLYREVLVAQPRNPAGLHLLGVVAYQAGKNEEAVRLIRSSLLLDPAEAGAWSNCGEALRALKHFKEAETCYREAIARAPTQASFWGNLGIVLEELDRSTEAEEAFRHALFRQPGYTKAWYNLGNLLRNAARFDEAETALQQALQQQPTMAEAWNSLGALRRKQLRLAEAESAYRKALELKPRFTDALSNLGGCLKDMGRLTDAEAVFRQVVAWSPNFAEGHSGIASVLRERGLSREASASYQDALRLRPGHDPYICALMFTQAANELTPQPDHFAFAKAWGAARTHPPLHTSAVVEVVNRPLRVGYLSSDYHHHAVARFVETLFASHDPARVELSAYSHLATPDVTTAAIQAKVRHWHPIFGLNDGDAARLIHSHHLDVLVDLNGHTRNSRTAILGYKPAPVQAVYLGYFATTGLSATDYWITDSILHPDDSPVLAVETLWRLPRCWIAYGPPAESPPVGVPTTSELTLGSFNHLAKVGEPTIDLWSSVLRALPSARLILKTRNLGELGTQKWIRDAFVAKGVSADRLTLSGHTAGTREHLRGYHDVDFALDPFPYTGGTTTCDALWMGVPVLTLRGEMMPSRMSASMLTSVQMTDWIAATPAEFVEKAVSQANAWQALHSAEKLSRREQIRAQAARSSLFDAPHLARALEDAYGSMVAIAASRSR